jgi:hypothetical protein
MQTVGTPPWALWRPLVERHGPLPSSLAVFSAPPLSPACISVLFQTITNNIPPCLTEGIFHRRRSYPGVDFLFDTRKMIL